MGTSALEFGSKSVPTILVRSSTLHYYYQNKSIKYKRLYEIEGNDLATEEFHANSASTIKDIIADIDNKGISYLSKQSYNHTLNNHSIDQVGRGIIKNLSKVQLSYHDIKESGIYELTVLEIFLLNLKNKFKKIKIVFS